MSGGRDRELGVCAIKKAMAANQTAVEGSGRDDLAGGALERPGRWLGGQGPDPPLPRSGELPKASRRALSKRGSRAGALPKRAPLLLSVLRRRRSGR